MLEDVKLIKFSPALPGRSPPAHTIEGARRAPRPGLVAGTHKQMAPPQSEEGNPTSSDAPPRSNPPVDVASLPEPGLGGRHSLPPPANEALLRLQPGAQAPPVALVRQTQPAVPPFRGRRLDRPPDRLRVARVPGRAHSAAAQWLPLELQPWFLKLSIAE